MNGWQTYRLEDFIPFTPEVYWRLLERINEAFWPLHVLAVAIGLAALLLALRGNRRTAGLSSVWSRQRRINWKTGPSPFWLQTASRTSWASFEPDWRDHIGKKPQEEFAMLTIDRPVRA